MNRQQYKPNQKVDVQFSLISHWEPGTIHKAYERGADVIIGNTGCWYIPYDRIKPRHLDLTKAEHDELAPPDRSRSAYHNPPPRSQS